MSNVSVKKNYFYNLIYQMLTVMLPIVITPYLSRTLGSESVGIYNYVSSIATYFVLVGTMGLSLFGQREIAYYQNDLEKRSKIFYSLLYIRMLFMVIAIAIYYFLFRNNSYSTYYFIFILHLLANLIDISWFYQGMENFKSVVIKNIFIKILYLVSIFIFIKNPSDLWKYILIYSLGNLIGNATLWFNINKYITKPLIVNPFIYFTGILALFIPQAASEIYTVFDKTMIGLITNSMNDVAYYGQSQKIVRMILGLITAVGIAVMPRIASLNSIGNKEKIRLYMNRTFSFVFMLSCPLMLGIISVSDSFVPIFFGPGYEAVIITLKFMGLIIISMSLSNVVGVQYLLPLKKQKEFNISIICGAISNFILNLIFINLFGYLGAVISTIISEFLIAVIQIYFVRKDFRLIDYFYKIIKYLFFAFLMFILCETIELICSTGYLTLFLQIICGGLFYFIILYISKDDFLLYCLNLVKQKTKKI